MKTYWAKHEVMLKNRKWYLIDATNMPIGRLAVEAAKILRGKNKVEYTPNVDCGDHLVIINADKVRLTGNNKKMEPIYHHTGYPGGLKEISRGKLLENQPVKLLTKVIWGMLPKTKLGKAMLKKVRIYAGSEHEQASQNPVEIKF